MGEECKVTAFEYFQNDDNWESHLRQIDTMIPTEIYRKLLEIKGNFNVAIGILQNDRGDSLKKDINILNDLTKKYLETDNKQFDIEIPETTIGECIKISTEIEEKREELRKLPGGDKENEINSIGDEISKLKLQLEALIRSNEKKETLAREEKSMIEEEITKLETQIDGTTGEITKLDITLLDIKAKEKLEEIKIKHYEKLLESNENEFKLKEMTKKGETTFLEVQLKQLKEQLEENDEEKIVKKFEEAQQNDIRKKINQNKNLSLYTKSGSSEGKDDDYLNSDEMSGDYALEKKDLYKGNKTYEEMGAILSGSSDLITMGKPKIFSKVLKGYTNVLTVNSKKFNDKLEKI